MIEAQGASEILSTNKKKNLALNTQADAPIRFSQLSKTNDLASAGDIFELGKSKKGFQKSLQKIVKKIVQKKRQKISQKNHADAPIRFSQLSKTNDLASAGDIFELGKSKKIVQKVVQKNSQKSIQKK